MRKLIVLSFISLDGVMQAPGGPEEDKTGGFAFGGWTVPYFDEFAGSSMGEQMAGSYDLLLGRRTYDIFASYWPEHAEEWPQINARTKYVTSHKSLAFTWTNSAQLKGDAAQAVRDLESSQGPDLQVHGSGDLIQTLLAKDLVDELWLKVFPLTLGRGKKLFGQGASPAAFELIDSKVSPKGVIFANYKRSGVVKTGSF